MVSRRAVLGGGVAGLGLLAVGGVGLVGAGVLPGQHKMRRALGACDVYVSEPRSAAGELIRGEFRSARRRAVVRYRIAYPPGARDDDQLPVCLVLHGFGGDEGVLGDGIALPRYLADVVADGVPPFVLAAADGGPRYWHPRADGDDPLGMLTDEFLPLLVGRGLEAGAGQRIGLLGYSMGGYGALLFAELYPTRVAAVAAGSPAIWRDYAEARQASVDAFDSAADWSRYDVLSRGSALAGMPVRVDYGRDDFIAPNMPALRDVLPAEATVRQAAGCHDDTFWRSVAPEVLTFIGRTFAEVPMSP
ncbi:alpha/beta hydrolase-fold protein [Cryptosporangium aurantiacum]|uniref:Acyl-CoA:diacylglycerol acyltransferase n=1 Tax=Cryptosporangium aurantiacum TaxID=134849 RepID=A0A1M7NFX8_9ACTN|nr:alpha/beta hydrolase-fold protein [Cryptosporangium aurantiacum]SHN02292.1 Enterochelin esterase [Cryptosporangium aurantiacum]